MGELEVAMQAILDKDTTPDVSEEDATGTEAEETTKEIDGETPPVEDEGETEETTEVSKIDTTDEGENKAEEPAEEEGEEKVEGPSEEPKASDAMTELRAIVRQQKKDLAIMRSKLDRISKRPERTEDDENLFGESEDKPTEAEELSEIERVQANINDIGKDRGVILDQLVEVMENNPKYENIREVCSAQNFDAVFDTIGKAMAEKSGNDPVLEALKAEEHIWSMPNPYKYMYQLISENHPAYAKKEVVQKAKVKEKAAPEKKAPEAKPAPSSVAGMPGGDGTGTSAWTAARIDEMDELELNKVPKDIYEKYLADQLE